MGASGSIRTDVSMSDSTALTVPSDDTRRTVAVQEWAGITAADLIVSLDTINSLPIPKKRKDYDTFLRDMLLKHTTITSMKLSVKAVGLFAARAKQAKKIINDRNQKGCTSAIACESLAFNVSPEITRQLSREEKIAEGKLLLDQRLHFLKLHMVEMVDDGNCQFRGFAYEIYGSQNYHFLVRQSIVAYLQQNSNHFSFYLGDIDAWNSYIQKMSEDRTWGDEITLAAASQLFRVNIHVLTTDSDNWLLCYDGRDSTHSASSADETRDLYLVYISPIHYNVLSLPP